MIDRPSCVGPTATIIALMLLAPGTLVQAGDISAREKGQRIGQAEAATRICPGARLTASAETVAATIPAADRGAFDAGSAEVKAAWAKAFDCVDTDPAMQRELPCRKMKILSCNAAWQEIGPDGTAMPGLIEFRAPD